MTSQYWIIGLDMQCRPVPAEVKYVREAADGGIVVESDGILIVIDRATPVYATRADASRAIA